MLGLTIFFVACHLCQQKRQKTKIDNSFFFYFLEDHIYLCNCFSVAYFGTNFSLKEHFVKKEMRIFHIINWYLMDKMGKKYENMKMRNLDFIVHPYNKFNLKFYLKVWFKLGFEIYKNQSTHVKWKNAVRSLRGKVT